MAVRREQFTTNLKDNIGVVNPTGYLEAADQTRRTAEAWGVATEKIVQGIDKLSDTIVGYQAEQALNNFKIDTKYTTRTDENGFKYTTVKLDIPKIRSFPFNPEINKQFEQEQFFILKQQVEDLYQFNSDNISQEIINNGGTFEDFELAIEPIERQIREELKDAPSTYGKIIQTLSPIKTKAQLAIQGANNQEVLESLKTRATLELDRIITGGKNAFLSGQSLQSHIDELKTIPQRYNIAAVREKQAVLTAELEGLQAIQKAFPKALAPADIDDTTELGLQRVQSNNAALGILATGSVNQVVLTLPDGKRRKVTKQEWLSITKGIDSNTLATVLDTFNTNNNIFKGMFDDAIVGTSSEELAQIINSGQEVPFGSKKYFNKLWSSASQEKRNEWVTLSTGQTGVTFTLDPKDTQNFIPSMKSLRRTYITEDIEDRLFTAMQTLALNPQLANQVIPELAYTTLPDGNRVPDEKNLFALYGQTDGDGAKASLLLNTMIQNYFTNPGGISQDFPQQAREILNMEPSLKLVNLKNTPGVDYTGDFVKAGKKFLKKMYGDNAPMWMVDNLATGFAYTTDISNWKIAKFKQYLEDRKPILEGFYGASKIQLNFGDKTDEDMLVSYPISARVYGDELYDAMVETLDKYIAENSRKQFTGTDDTQRNRMKLGKNIFLVGLNNRAYTNNQNEVAMQVVKYDGKSIEAIEDKNGNHMIIYPFEITTQTIEDDLMKTSAFKRLRQEGIGADEARQIIAKKLGNR